MRSETIACALALFATAGCGSPAQVGSDVVWIADHETGDTSQWTADMAGGVIADSGAMIEVTGSQAHRGRYSLHFSTADPPGDGGPRVFRHGGLPADGYYSAWYLVPRPYETDSYWTVMKLEVADPTDAQAVVDDGFDLDLRSLQGGQLVLELFYHSSAHLLAPLSYPTPLVPIGSWFQLEVRFVATGAARGSLTVWLDGRRVYDVAGWSNFSADALYFMPCDLTASATPSPVELYMDDAVISLSRVTPAGVLP